MIEDIPTQTIHKAASSKPDMKSQWPTFGWIRASVHRLFAFGLGAGLVRPGPGTWGTLLAWVLWWPLSFVLGTDFYMALFILACFAYGVYCCHRVAQEMHVDDHGGIVWDEMVAFWAVLLLVAPMNLGWQLVAFILFRFFDIVKPPPIGYFDRTLKNGFGVMWDDVVAAAYTLFVMALATRILG